MEHAATRRALVVDDDQDVAWTLADALSADSWRCEIATSAEGALAACRATDFDAVLTDVQMPGMDGFELMSRLRGADRDVPVVLITARGSIPAAVAAVRNGASHYLTKPCNVIELRRTMRDAVARREASSGTTAPSFGDLPDATEELAGSSAAMCDLRHRVRRAAATEAPVLVTGETGTGKELVARAVHASSARRARPFVTVNTAAIPAALIESELFGHVRGAFTGAAQAHLGLFHEAEGGTLFLDEIGDMPLLLQAKLLRVLQGGEVRAVGSDRERRVDVRIVAATHRPLADLVRDGLFRADLFYRLNIIRVAVPPLRARGTDVPELARLFLARALERAPRSRVRSIGDDVVARFAAHDWPGNVRELESMVERLVILVPDAVVTLRHLELVGDEIPLRAPSPQGAGSSMTTGSGDPLPLDHVVRRHVEEVLAHTGGKKALAAKILRVDLSTLYRWGHKA